MLSELKKEVCAANRALETSGLVKLTWGNVSGIDRASGLWCIKPSGVPYAELEPDDLVVLDLEGKVVEGTLRPSSDTRTHLHLYREFSEIGGITHTHSPYATMFAQASRELPCYGTTHADHFFGTVPVARSLSKAEIDHDYEHHTGVAIVECFRKAPAQTAGNARRVPGLPRSFHLGEERDGFAQQQHRPRDVRAGRARFTAAQSFARRDSHAHPAEASRSQARHGGVLRAEEVGEMSAKHAKAYELLFCGY